MKTLLIVVAFVIASIFMAVMLYPLDRERLASTADPRPSFEHKRDLLSSVQKGMTEHQVLEIMGEPDEIRTELGMDVTNSRWAYGTQCKGEFPRIGAVNFGSDNTALSTFCPARGIDGAMNECFVPSVPFSKAPQKTPSGMYCKIDEVFRNAEFSNSHYIQVSLVNEGKARFLYPHDNTGIRFSLILEVYDEDQNILLRDPLFSYGAPYYVDRNKWPVLEVPPDSRVSEDVPIWWWGRFDGILCAGTYYYDCQSKLRRLRKHRWLP